MAKQKLSDNEIIKAFADLVERKPYYLYQEVLNLISRQSIEIERLQNQLADECQHTIEFRNNTIDELSARIKSHLKRNGFIWCSEVEAIAEEMKHGGKERTFTKVDHKSLCETETFEGRCINDTE